MKHLAALLILAAPALAQEVLIPEGDSWRYLDDGSNQGLAWRLPGFDDSSWAVGNAQLGYGDGDETTVVSFGGNPNNKFITTYFRREFQSPDPSGYFAVRFRVLRDDGVILYINGQEVVRYLSTLRAFQLDCCSTPSSAL